MNDKIVGSTGDRFAAAMAEGVVAETENVESVRLTVGRETVYCNVALGLGLVEDGSGVKSHLFVQGNMNPIIMLSLIEALDNTRQQLLDQFMALTTDTEVKPIGDN